MKISFEHLLKHIHQKPEIADLSRNLLQLGHEHEIVDQILDIEFTPNRGDCLSLFGLLKDLNIFYKTNLDHDIYTKDIKPFNMDFTNKSPDICPKITFLKIDISDDIQEYSKELSSYFSCLGHTKNNFFTDVSNYISYETGQPTHCYDASKITHPLIFEEINGHFEFENLLGNNVKINENNAVFISNKEIINLAGIIGNKNTSCSEKTRSVIVECAYFTPEAIIGKSTKYGIKSDAAYKFERGVDYSCHEFILRRFLKIVSDHTTIKNVEIYSKNFKEIPKKIIDFDSIKINQIVGTNLSDKDIIAYLNKLDFIIKNNEIFVPYARMKDITTINDIAEEIARVVGYNNIPSKSLVIPRKNAKEKNIYIDTIKKYLIDNGFYEVINNPFVSSKSKNLIEVDNPLDSNKNLLRADLKQSLIDNLLFNERRQKDSVKLFEISDLYSSVNTKHKKCLGLIVSGRVGHNYRDFSKKIDETYLKEIIKDLSSLNNIKIENIPREILKTKNKDLIFFTEINLSDVIMNNLENIESPKDIQFNKYKKISEYPSSSRDISFSINNPSELKKLEKIILNYDNSLLKESFVFDFYHNEKNKLVKIGFRFIFQSNVKTITDDDVNKIMDDIIKTALSLKSVKIPGI